MSQDTQVLLRTLHNDIFSFKSPKAQIKVVNDLSILKEPDDINALIDAMNNSSEWADLRCCIADALGNIGDDQAIPHLIRGLYHSVEPLPRHCAQALVKFGSRGLDMLSAIRKGKYEWPNYSTHLNEMGLKNIRLAVIAGMGASQNPIVTPYLLESLKDQDQIVATEAVRALGELGDRSVADTLLGLYNGESDPRKKTVIRQSLSKLGIDTFEPAERIAAEAFLSNLKALKTGMSEREVEKLIGKGAYQTGTRIVYRNQYGEFQLIISNGRLVEIPEGFGPARLIKEMEETLSIKN